MRFLFGMNPKKKVSYKYENTFEHTLDCRFATRHGGRIFKIMHYTGSGLIMMTGFISAFAGILLISFTRKKTRTP